MERATESLKLRFWPRAALPKNRQETMRGQAPGEIGTAERVIVLPIPGLRHARVPIAAMLPDANPVSAKSESRRNVHARVIQRSPI